VQMFTPDVAQTREMDYVRVGREDRLDEQLGDGRAVGLLRQFKETPGHGCVKMKPLQFLNDRGRRKADMAKTRRRIRRGLRRRRARGNGQAKTLELTGLGDGQGSVIYGRGYVTCRL
jgi:hypothetical protein